jgi:hypothetical protein
MTCLSYLAFLTSTLAPYICRFAQTRDCSNPRLTPPVQSPYSLHIDSKDSTTHTHHILSANGIVTLLLCVATYDPHTLIRLPAVTAGATFS